MIIPEIWKRKHPPTKEEPLAAQYFNAYCTLGVMEEELGNRIDDICGVQFDIKTLKMTPDYDDITFDYYDESFSFSEMDEEWDIPKSAYQALAELGFNKCWVFYKGTKADVSHNFRESIDK